MSTITFANSQIRDKALEALNDLLPQSNHYKDLMSSDITFTNSQIRDKALKALNDSFVHSNYHRGLILRDGSIYSNIDEDHYIHEDLCSCEYSACGGCFHREVNDYVVTEDNGTYYCSCECAEQDGQYWHYDDCWYDHPESNGGIQEYHTGDRDIRSATNRQPYRIGFEIEKCDVDCRDNFEDGDLCDGWIAENDSSISGDGAFELISPAYNLADKDAIVRDIKQLSYYINADSNLSCGGHITISKFNTSGIQFAEENRGLFPLLMCLYPKRLRSSFVKSGKYEKIKNSDDKYRPFRIDGNIIELRIISRVVNVDCLIWRLDLLQYMLENDLSLEDTRESLQNGWLNTHLSKVYNAEQLETRIGLFDQFAEYFYDLVSTVSSHIAEYLTEQVA